VADQRPEVVKVFARFFQKALLASFFASSEAAGLKSDNFFDRLTTPAKKRGPDLRSEPHFLQ
jgi:hypothetical protein